MSQDERRSEQFIREVDEEFRRDQLKSLWNRFGLLIIATCVLVVLVTAGYRGWLWWQGRQMAAASDRYLAAVDAVGAGIADADAALKGIAEEGGGYGVLARLRLAAAEVAAGATDAALADLDAIAADASVPLALRDLARIRAGLVALDAGKLDAAAERVAALDQSGNAWRNIAREILGQAAYRKGELARARDLFAGIQMDAAAQGGLSQRADMMMALIEGQLPPAADAAGPAPAPATGGAAAPGGGALDSPAVTE